MQNITIQKQLGSSYHGPLKAYDVTRDGKQIGTLQTWGTVWEVYDVDLSCVAKHTTIKAAVRVAGRVL